MPLSNEKLAILERFGDGDIQDMVAEIRLLRKNLEDILYCPQECGVMHLRHIGRPQGKLR